MGTTVSLPLLDQVRVASPCTARWSEMVGDDRRRHCAQCNLDVHNISSLTREEAESVLQGLAHGRVCARFYRRADGTILTRDCPRGIAIVRRKLLLGASRFAAAIGFAVLATMAARAAEERNGRSSSSGPSLAASGPMLWLNELAWEARAKFFPRSMPSRMIMGDMALPPTRGCGGQSTSLVPTIPPPVSGAAP